MKFPDMIEQTYKRFPTIELDVNGEIPDAKSVLADPAKNVVHILQVKLGSDGRRTYIHASKEVETEVVTVPREQFKATQEGCDITNEFLTFAQSLMSQQEK